MSLSFISLSRWAWLSLALISLTHFTLPLVADEAYYTWWASRPRLGYLDHPPAVMAWAWVGERLFWGPRALNLLTLPLMGLLITDLSRALHLRGAHLIAPVALLTPLGFALGVLVTPDAPLTLGWLLALWGWGRGRWVASAVGLSLALWAKPTALLAALTLCGAWATRPERSSASQGLRDALKVAALTLLLYSPHLMWSLTHGGAPWTFQAGRAWGRFGLLEWLASQAWVMSPLWAWWGVSVAMRQALDKSESARRLLALLGLSQLAPWLCVSLVMRVEANWSALAWPPLLLLALDQLSAHPHKVRLACRFGVALTLPLALSPTLSALLPLSVGPPRDPERVGRAVEACLSQPPSQPLSQLPSQPLSRGTTARRSEVVAGRYQEAALLWRAGVPFQYLNALNRRESEFMRAPELNRTPTQHKARGCGFLYLGPEAWLGERCEGERVVMSAERCELPDRLKATLCRCIP